MAGGGSVSCNVLSQYDDLTVIRGPGLWSTFSLTGRYCWQTSPEVTLPRYPPPPSLLPPSPHPPPGLIRADDINYFPDSRYCWSFDLDKVKYLRQLWWCQRWLVLVCTLWCQCLGCVEHEPSHPSQC